MEKINHITTQLFKKNICNLINTLNEHLLLSTDTSKSVDKLPALEVDIDGPYTDGLI